MVVGNFGGEKEGQCSKGVRDGYGMGLSKATTSSWKDFKSRSCLITGNGRKVKFSKD